MKDQIGKTAGAIWEVLRSNDRVALSQLPRAVKERDSVAYQALGWLAREDKIIYETQGKKTYVALAEKDRS